MFQDYISVTSHTVQQISLLERRSFHPFEETKYLNPLELSPHVQEVQARPSRGGCRGCFWASYSYVQYEIQTCKNEHDSISKRHFEGLLALLLIHC